MEEKKGTPKNKKRKREEEEEEEEESETVVPRKKKKKAEGKRHLPSSKKLKQALKRERREKATQVAFLSIDEEQQLAEAMGQVPKPSEDYAGHDLAGVQHDFHTAMERMRPHDRGRRDIAGAGVLLAKAIFVALAKGKPKKAAEI